MTDPEDTEDELELEYEDESDEEIDAASGVDHDSQCTAEQSILAQNPDIEEELQLPAESPQEEVTFVTSLGAPKQRGKKPAKRRGFIETPR